MDVLDQGMRFFGLRRKRGHFGLAAAAVACGAGLAAGLVYMLDPARGAQRRARVLDGGVHFLHRTGVALREGARLLLGGLVAAPRVAGGLGAVSFRESITIDAPVEDVFAIFTHFEDFPRFMPHVCAVELNEDGSTRWTALGPAGVPVRWDAELTALVPNQLVAWCTVPGSAVPNAGAVQFTASEGGATRIDVEMSYEPPAGWIGHAVAALFGAGPERAIAGDLARLKALIEVRDPGGAALGADPRREGDGRSANGLPR